MNAPPITVEDFKNVLLDLYLVQRDNAALRAELGHHGAEATPKPEDGGESP